MNEPKIIEHASSKMLRACEKFAEGEKILHEITADDLVKSGYAVNSDLITRSGDLQDKSKFASNMIYEVFGHATAVKIVREALMMKYLSGHE